MICNRSFCMPLSHDTDQFDTGRASPPTVMDDAPHGKNSIPAAYDADARAVVISIDWNVQFASSITTPPVSHEIVQSDTLPPA